MRDPGTPWSRAATGSHRRPIHSTTSPKGEAWHPENQAWDSGIPFQSFFLMDDLVLVEPDLGRRAHVSLALWEEGPLRSLGEEAHNLEKDFEEGRLEAAKLIWGLLYDAIRMRVALPVAKIEKAYHLLHLPDFSRECKTLEQKLVQELRGSQQYWSWIKRTLKPLFGATDELLSQTDARGHVRPKWSARRQRLAWEEFWEAVELQRVLVQSPDFFEARFSDGL